MDVSISIRKGVFLGIIGPNGAGKTTFLKTLLGLIRPARGVVLYKGEKLDRKRLSKEIGYVPQKVFYRNNFPIKVREFLEVSLEGKGGSLDTYVEVMGIKGLMDKVLWDLSGGEFQRVLICSAISREPEVLIMDEPNTGLDSVGQEEFYRLLEGLRRDRGTTIIMVSHDVGVISRYVDEVACLNRRLYFHGSPGEEMERSLLDTYGREMDLVVHGERCEEGLLERREIK